MLGNLVCLLDSPSKNIYCSDSNVFGEDFSLVCVITIVIRVFLPVELFIVKISVGRFS